MCACVGDTESAVGPRRHKIYVDLLILYGFSILDLSLQVSLIIVALDVDGLEINLDNVCPIEGLEDLDGRRNKKLEDDCV